MVDVLRSKLLSDAGFAHGFSLRTGGVSKAPFDSGNLGRGLGDDAAVETNHRSLGKAIGYERVFELSQVHGRRVRPVSGTEDPVAVRQEEGDGLLTFEAGLALGVRTADCVPVLIADARLGAVAAVHAGWRGVESGIVGVAIEGLLDGGSRPEDLRVALGPHLRVENFEVGEDVAERLRQAVPAGANADPIWPRHPRPHVSVASILSAQLQGYGVEAIDDLGLCTHGDPARFFSYRRDGQESGRHLGVIVSR